MNDRVQSDINLSIEIPRGALFYPCCGMDTRVPIRIFLGSLSEFHFADIWDMGLPCIKTTTQWREAIDVVLHYGKFLEGRNGELAIKPRWHITSFEHREQTVTEEAEINAKSIADNPLEVRVNRPAEIYEELWGSANSEEIARIICHKADGVVTLLELQNLAVFFYRGDSFGEGGSGQWWLGPKLFNLVLAKLLDGGLIITDGSNPDPLYRDAEWNKLWTEKGDFIYNGRLFKHLGRLGTQFRQSRPTHVWKVNLIKGTHEKAG